MTQADLKQYLSNSNGLPRSTTLFREPGLRALLLHLNPGENIPEHQTRGSIAIHCLDGRGTFFVGEDRIDLQPGLLLSLPPAALHSVAAAEDRHLLLFVTVSEPVDTQ